MEYNQIRDAKIPDHEKLPKTCIFYKHYMQVECNTRIADAARTQIREDKELLDEELKEIHDIKEVNDDEFAVLEERKKMSQRALDLIEMKKRANEKARINNQNALDLEAQNIRY